MKKNPTRKRMRCVFFLQISSLHPSKQKYKSEKETFYFYYKKINKKKTYLKKNKINFF
jgi:hypothetical protein